MRLAVLLIAFLAAGDVTASALPHPRLCAETLMNSATRPSRSARWAEGLGTVDVKNVVTRATQSVRLYANDGTVDERARREFERVASVDGESHPLAIRLEQLVMKAAYHFGSPRVLVVSAWRANAGRHGTGEAVDFKLESIPASQLAAYARQFSRVGVGVYTHPRTQFVHLDVRESSYHWIDASPPGVKWREAVLRDAGSKRRDDPWTPAMDLP